MRPETTNLVAQRALAKGDVLAVARIAGIQAAKRTSDLLPLCHPVMVGAVLINFAFRHDYIEVEAQVATFDRTGVEMEALTAASVAALTVYDMCKALSHDIIIKEIKLLSKSGGKSDYTGTKA